MNNLTRITALLATLFMLGGCVPANRFHDLEERYNNSRAENRRIQAQLADCREQEKSMDVELKQLRPEAEALKTDTQELGQRLRRLQQRHDLYIEQTEALMEGKTEETRAVMMRLQETQADLQRREDELQKAMQEMQAKENSLNALNAIVSEKEQRVNELESILHRQDSVVQALRQTVSGALLGFQDEGLSVEIRNGKVYVSLEESLLFATGSTSVDNRGERALGELARVLEQSPDINIMIEGHTDDVPFRPGGTIRDNWELSVLRATAIVRILLKHGDIDPQRLMAAGRGEHHPLETERTPEARARNRRTEIILTPQLDELFRIIEQH